jgi:hypothetical protein
MFPPCNVLMFAAPSTVAAAAADAAPASSASASSSSSSSSGKSKSNAMDDKESAPSGAAARRAAAAAANSSSSSSSAGISGAASAALGFAPLVATGSVHSIDPTRCIIKRIVLSGYPVSVHKRMAVIRYMFYRPDDIKWFKPVELHTKNGLTGHVREPRGTKGYMKCNFSDFIKSNDTVTAALLAPLSRASPPSLIRSLGASQVYMNLYKRQFPKWDPAAFNTPH